MQQNTYFVVRPNGLRGCPIPSRLSSGEAKGQWAFTRWDEKAGLQAGCDTLPMKDVLKAQKETGNEED